MKQNEIIKEIIKERKRQDGLHPSNNSEDYLSIMIEEVGEVGKALQGEGYLVDELIQVAAVVVRWLESL